ncbi:PilW family protein [Pseudomonas marincola]|uniref:PilW family protein n=1 Tax=Pseudomonas marincola TaxID=437900 RepID=UPI0008F3E9E4|nr:PilW family protein [Pseudomonas marincola]SFT66738.1 type IV pilus assembly protein PilW [Pseudomonas marincola]
MSHSVISRQYGLSLVELMVSMVIALILMLGVMQVFLSTKQTYSTNSALSRIQESGRFSIGFLTQAIRGLGFTDLCFKPDSNHLTASQTTSLELNQPLQGWDDVERKPAHLNGTPIKGTDVLLVKYAAGSSSVEATLSNAAASDSVRLLEPSAIDYGAVALITDGLGCDLFLNAATASDKTVSKHDASKPWSRAYSEEVDVLGVHHATYYIRKNMSGNSSLFRQRLNPQKSLGELKWTTEELIENIQDMQISYGLSGDDKQVTRYVTADQVPDWQSVVSVHVEILVVSPQLNAVTENQTIKFNGVVLEIPSRKLAEVFSNTISIRNRLP